MLHLIELIQLVTPNTYMQTDISFYASTPLSMTLETQSYEKGLDCFNLLLERGADPLLDWAAWNVFAHKSLVSFDESVSSPGIITDA
jgi:hypothetical protein